MYGKMVTVQCQLGLFTCIWLATNAMGGAPAPKDEYVFVPTVERTVGVIRGQFLYVGGLDAAGNFEHYQRPHGAA